MRTLILKPGGVLFVTGALASLGALAFSRPAKERLRDAPIQTAPISLFASKKVAAAGVKGPFDTKDTMVPIDLTSIGAHDWVCWGVGGTSRAVHKADRSAAARIGDYSLIQPKDGLLPVGAKQGPSRGLWWTDGSAPLPKTSVTYSGIHVGANNGFRFKVPADSKTERTLHVYVGGWKAGGDLSAFVSDGSAAKIEKQEVALGNGYYSRAYAITYKAAAQGQDMTVVWKMHSGDGNISLQGAALE